MFDKELKEVMEDETEQEKSLRMKAELKDKQAKLAKAKAEAAKIAAQLAVRTNTENKPKKITKGAKYKKMWGLEYKGKDKDVLVDD